MAYYAYKVVRDLVPKWITDAAGEDYEGDGNYDGDLHYAAAAYIVFLESKLKCVDLSPTPEDIDNAKAQF